MPLDYLNTLYASEHWPFIAHLLRLLLFAALLWGGWVLWRTPVPSTRKKAALPWNFRIFMAGLIGGFVVVLLHQATWQLAGQRKPEFVAFMQLHDRRAFNPAHRIERGRVLDRNGLVLAESDPRQPSSGRRYPFGPAAAHVVGYTHPRFGAYGMERAGNATLLGASLSSIEEWRRLGQGIFDSKRRIVGRDLSLTIDARLQKRAYSLMRFKTGAVVVMHVRTGDILALVSTPSFDPNRIDAELFAGRRGSSVLLNRATHGLYPPGSAFKLITAALALEQGFTGTLNCPAEGWTTSPANPKIRDYGYYAAQEKGTVWAGYGDLDLGTALAKSSNVFFARLGVQYGLKPMNEMARAFHLDERLLLYQQFGLSYAAAAGRFPALSERDRYGLAQVSIGQGQVLMTPLLMTLTTAAIANNGVAPRPRLSLDTPVSRMKRSLSTDAAGKLAWMMRRVVTEGTGRRLAGSSLSPAGKTGTAENSHGESHAWFVGFAPHTDAKLAVGVLVEQGGFGSRAALPIAQELLEGAASVGYLEPVP